MIRFLATALGSAILMALWLAVREERDRQLQRDTVTEHDGAQWTWTQA